MNLQAQNYFDELDPNDLRNIVRELQIRLAKLERSTLKVGSLDHLSNDMGEQEVGTVNNLTARGEMKTFYFATDNQLAVGGTILVCKDAGKTAAGIAAADTTVDFGKAMTVSDWVKFQGPDINGTNAVERMLVGSLVSGTLYNVTRNVDGSGANDWANAAPFAVIGQSGDSRIERHPPGDGDDLAVHARRPFPRGPAGPQAGPVEASRNRIRRRSRVQFREPGEQEAVR